MGQGVGGVERRVGCGELCALGGLSSSGVMCFGTLDAHLPRCIKNVPVVLSCFMMPWVCFGYRLCELFCRSKILPAMRVRI